MKPMFESKRTTEPARHFRAGQTEFTRCRVARGENVDFICWYLFNNPGARYTHVLRALCDHNGIEYQNGQYSNYFNSGFGNNGHVDHLWRRCGAGWILTLDGMARYGEWCV